MRAGIALGANVGNRLQNLRVAHARVFMIPGIGGPAKTSRIYETEPVGCPPGTAPFLNAVLEVEWNGFSSDDLLSELRGIERALGRLEHRLRNAPRVIDLDLLYLDELQMSDESLTLPHPRLHARRFVLAPLADICPGLILPNQTKTIAQLLAELPPEPRAIPTDLSF